MADNSSNALHAMANALEVIVAPTVDRSDPIAHEQLQSAVRYLHFLESRMDYVYDRERFELRHHLRMADELMAHRSAFPLATDILERVVDAGTVVLQCLGEGVPALRARTARLTSAIRMVVHEAASSSPDVRAAIERIVLQVSEERIELDRSWYFPLGFEHSPDDVTPLVDALRPVV